MTIYRRVKMTLLTYSEWEKLLFIEDVELTCGNVPRTTDQLRKLWQIYKDHNSGYKIASERYTKFGE